MILLNYKKERKVKMKHNINKKIIECLIKVLFEFIDEDDSGLNEWFYNKWEEEYYKIYDTNNKNWNEKFWPKVEEEKQKIKNFLKKYLTE